MKKGHWLLLSLTGSLIVLLLLAPKHPDSETAVADTAADLGNPPNVENQIDSALSIIAGSQPMQGILMLRQIAEEHPDNFRAQYNLGLFAAKTNQWEKVIERFQNLEKIDPQFSVTHYWLGRAKYEQGKMGEARMSLVKYLSADADDQQLKMEAETMLKQIKLMDNAKR